MIYGIGIDLVELDRIKKIMQGHGERFLRMVFTDNEIQSGQKGFSVGRQYQYFAGRFAAKEAFLKAIGTGLRKGFHWKDIEIVNDELGKPDLIAKNKMSEVIQKNGIANIRLSISHTQSSATAVVILEV
jgi:holo-[acyl-carrier protein] synthase